MKKLKFGTDIDNEIERLENKYRNKRLREDKFEFTKKRLLALKKLCLLNNIEANVENGFSLLLSGANLKKAMKDEKAHIISQDNDYNNLKSNVDFYAKKYKYNNDQINCYRAIRFCSQRIFDLQEIFYFPKIVNFDVSLIKMQIHNQNKYPNSLVVNFFQIMGVKVKDLNKLKKHNFEEVEMER